MNGEGVDLAPALAIVAVGIVLALGPLAWLRVRRHDDGPVGGLRALAVLTLFLTFDLVLLGAFTRLSDSGLGCPDWPGCYGHASPLGAAESIARAEAAVPTGAVTHRKAWIEMTHRYAATGVGVLVFVIAAWAVRAARRTGGRAPAGPAIVTFVWVCLQGAFGALTVTMKLAPAIVTLHLLGGFALLALLAMQCESYAPRRLALGAGLRAGLVVVVMLAVVQMALGGWVSTNYAVLACRDFPTCQGAWWPRADFAQGFVLVRPLGAEGADGDGYLPFAALTAIHLAHRIGALVVVPALAVLAWALARRGGADARPWALALIGIAAWQVASGLGNVLLGWPLVAAVAHTGGSAALVVVLTVLVVRGRSRRPARDEGEHRDDRHEPAARTREAVFAKRASVTS